MNISAFGAAASALTDSSPPKGSYQQRINNIQTAQMMRQATHCFEPQRKAFGRQYVMPLYLVYFSCACHPSDFTKHTPPFGECDFPKPWYTSCFCAPGLKAFNLQDQLLRKIHRHRLEHYSASRTCSHSTPCYPQCDSHLSWVMIIRPSTKNLLVIRRPCSSRASTGTELCRGWYRRFLDFE